MADSERRIFPVETVLALVASKADADLKEIAGYILGESIQCNCKARAVAPFAAAWIARLYPKLADLVWDEGKESWSNFVVRGAHIFGDKVSLPAMAGGMKETCQNVLKSFAEKMDEVAALQREVAALSAQVEALKPLEAQLKAAQQKADKFEAQLKDQKKEMGALRRQTMEFQGKMALNEEELLDTIKNAIKENLKHVAIAAAPAAGAAPAAAAAAAAAGAGVAAAAAAGGDEFGFGGGSGDEFGFGGSGDEFGFGGGAGGGDDFGFGGGASAAAQPAPAPAAEPADEFGFGGGSSSNDEFGF